MNQYNDSFYNSQIKESKNSAIKIVPIVQNLVNPKSIVDVGCGVGAWLNIWKELHPELKVKGIDTNYFSIDKLQFIDDGVGGVRYDNLHCGFNHSLSLLECS